MRAAWPLELPRALAYPAAHHGRGGLTLGGWVAGAAKLREEGADLLLVVTGQTTADSHPEYGRMYGVPHSDRVRNEAGVATIAFGQIFSLDEINTMLAAGRAGLCVLDRQLSPAVSGDS